MSEHRITLGDFLEYLSDFEDEDREVVLRHGDGDPDVVIVLERMLEGIMDQMDEEERDARDPRWQ